MALIGGVIRNSASHATIAFASACLCETLTCASTDGYGIWNALWGYEGICVRHIASGFYSKDVNYTSADWAYYPAYNSYGYWKVVELNPEPPPPPDCCFAGNTLIQMADGSTKPIAEVTIGEYVVGRGGTLSRVVGVERPLLQGRQLYAINRDSPFVTAEHPFLSNTGWRAIDPAALAFENAKLPARRLAVGDMLLAARAIRIPVAVGGVLDRTEVGVEEVRVASLDGFHADPSSIVYNLLLDGDHTYIANGFIVHNKGSH